MSYLAGAALQGAVYQALRESAALHALVGDAIYDALPVTPPAGTYIALGPEEVRDAGDATGRASAHDFVVSVLSGADDTGGFAAIKSAAAAASEALETGSLPLAKGRLAGLWFVSARARRAETGSGRRVDMTFRARVDLGQRAA